MSTDNQDFVDITLRRPIKISGVEVKALRMREPTVADQLVAQKIGRGENAEVELALFANLCGVAPDELRAASLRDYIKLQESYRSFLS